ncbi:DUF924 family protein [Nitrincola schmidtii]|uniref:DUF924 family protein n=1 Tax=Nitrincola schmidtii TaxID=1730894 RepID=UPI00124D4F37|nr:DUF924 family protein [Nitrincola schmidtii]
MQSHVLDFWFKELEPKQWWEKNHQLDLMIQTKFGSLHQQAKAGELFEWRETPSGSLAEVIVLDQFSRNIFRDTSESFASDPLALALAQFAISKGFDLELPPTERSFLYLPFMHSESKVIHQQAIKLFEALGNANSLEFERKHKVIIDRFGRYPHRNSILGRVSTDEEVEFLKEPDSSF